MQYIFRKAAPSEPAIVYSMIQARMQWMTDHGIQHWNVFEYDTLYPLSYYEENMKNLFVLVTSANQQIISAATLFETDMRWDTTEPALYIHNFVSRVGVPHAGSLFLQYAEHYALEQKKHYLRLDSSEDSPALTQYYNQHGFEPVGTCIDGDYHGILRQKHISTHTVSTTEGEINI